MTARRARTLTNLAIWAVAIALSYTADRWVASQAMAHHVPQWLKRTHVADVLKAPGDFPFTVGLAIVATVMYAKKPRWHGGRFILLCALLSGVNGLIKWVVGRARPYRALNVHDPVPLEPYRIHPFFHGLAGLIGTSNLCFPSGHAALAFANAAGFSILFPRWRWLAYTIATLTAAERCLETAHYFSDCVAAAALGIGGAHLLAWLLSPRDLELQDAG
jgi:membrane-associated phospholipid phosphatase